MGCCSIYNKSFMFDINQASATIDKSKLSQFINAYDAANSGIWQPMIIKLDKSNLVFSDILIQPDTKLLTSFDPCNCNTGVVVDINAIKDTPQINCNYCNPMLPTAYSKTWKLKDTNGVIPKRPAEGGWVDVTFTSDCCAGACDTRMRFDDFLPKIPILNQQYLTKFYDYKYLNQFPSCTNPGLGFDKFISFDRLNSFEANSPKLVIDWDIKARISEIPYDKFTSQYDNIEDHNKAYARSLQSSQTCGNFILTQINPTYSGINPYYPMFSGLVCDPDQTLVKDSWDKLLPSVDQFNVVPYGFSKNTYDNIFVKQEKIGSHWKWNYSSGILGWYRYYNKDLTAAEDKRLIPGVDLYVSPGDVFYASNDGPEPTPTANATSPSDISIKSCPSGLKLFKNNSVTGVIPSGSQFTYISANLYESFKDILYRLEKVKTDWTKKQLFEKAALLCTAPEYDNITVDLFKRNSIENYAINSNKQLDLFNKNMSTSKIGSINGLYFIQSSGDLINTLANKYGSYVSFVPNTDSSLTLSQSINSQAYVDLSFDMVVKLSDTKRLGTCVVTTDCSDSNPTKKFTYSQSISLSNLKIESKINTRLRYDVNCTNGVVEKYKSARMAGIYLNDSLVKEIPYSSGCVIYQDNYPRISIVEGDSATTQFCNECGPDSSYKLALNKLGNEDICWYYQNDLSFCDFTLARYYNNNELGGSIGYRPSRSILDGTLYFKRKYNATALNNRIDKAAFHSQGGVYYDSRPFGISKSTVFINNTPLTEGKAKVSFNTKDSSIRLYSFKVEKLRGSNSDTYNCVAFPNKNSCGCFSITHDTEFPYLCSTSLPIVFTNSPLLYTPALSTTNSPSLKAYGGYSSVELSKLLNNATPAIPNHPAVGSVLASVNKKIDPINPYGCEQSITVNLPNYVKTSWHFTLPGYSTVHSDVWAEILEDVDLFKPANFQEIEIDDGFWEDQSTPNLGYQRFASKVDINDIILYDKQKKVILEKGNGATSAVTVFIVNPYLAALLGGEYVLYPPSGLCSSKTIYGTRGDESVVVPIKFTRIPRKQILHFAIPGPEPMGYLKRGSFHPNSGISYRDITNSPVVKNTTNHTASIDYDRDLFQTEQQKGTVLIGSINDRLTSILNQINDFDNHRKIKLYLQLGGLWYEYDAPNTLGFIKQDKVFIGDPNLFHYTSKDSENKFSGPIIPISPKEHINFQFIYNFLPTGINPLIYNSNSYPIAKITATKIKDKKVTVDGTRLYFQIAEKDNAVISLSKTIALLTQEDQDLITPLRPELVLNNALGPRFRLKANGPRTHITSYVEVDYNYLYTNFSDLTIDYSDIGLDGYVRNTKKTCDQTVVLINADNKKQIQSIKIIEKSIYLLKIDKNGNKLKFNNITAHSYIQPYTMLTFETKLKYDTSYVYTATMDEATSNYNGSDSLIVYQEQPLLKQEKDPLLYNPYYKTKWGDLLEFDHKLTNELYQNSSLLDQYPDSLYDNNFYKILINNTNTGLYNYSVNGTNIVYSGLVNYIIHQKYNIGMNKLLVDETVNYENYLPFMDINFIPNPGVSTNDITSKLMPIIDPILVDVNNQNIASGNIKISGMHKNLDSTHKWENGYIDPKTTGLFWMSLPTGKIFKSALTIVPGQTFYSNTLRIDNAQFQLYSINFSQSFNAANCRTVFRPSVTQTNETFPSKVFNFNHFTATEFSGNSFAKFPIYCDTDHVEGCVSDRCGINTAGVVSFSGTYLVQKTNTIAIAGDNIPYIISCDAGIYNALGNNKQSYIQRIELNPANTLYPTTNCDSSVAPRPVDKLSVLNEEYQSVLSNNIVTDHTDVVKNTDILANEMLFRLMYGEKQKINYATIDSDDDSVELQDLIKYSDPKTEAKDIYRNIPYDLDTAADSSNRKVSGNISIKGILQVGKRISATIGTMDITFDILRQDGKILLQTYSNGTNIYTVLHDEYTDNKSILASSGPATPPNATTTYSLVKHCKELQQNSISAVSTFKSGKICGTRLCDGTIGCVDFPFIKNTFDCWANGQYGYNTSPCYKTYITRLISEIEEAPQPWNNEQIQTLVFLKERQKTALDIPPIALYHLPACLPIESETGCTNRGVVADLDTLLPNPSCSFLSKEEYYIKTGGGYARGIFTSSDRHYDGFSEFNSIDAMGGILDGVGGTILTNVGSISNVVISNPPVCGTCFTMDYETSLKEKKYTIFGKGRFPPAPGDTSESCECADYTYAYCRNSNNSSCLCKTLTYDYAEFDYNFGYCRYDISLKGHKRKTSYTDKDNNGITITPGLCDITVATAVVLPPDTRPGLSGVSAEAMEVCAYISCPGALPTDWHIYEVKSRTPGTSYVAGCARTLCNIAYDNNLITISSLPGVPLDVGVDIIPICVDTTIRDNCPIIKITVPDESFTVVDSITGECDSCGVSPNKISMPEQKQNWDIVTLTKTCVLGYLAGVGPNAQLKGASNLTIDKPLYQGTSCRADMNVGGTVQCGKGGFPWSLCLADSGEEGRVCREGTSYYSSSAIVGCGIGISLMANDAPIEVITEAWKAQMRQTYLNTAPCFNHKSEDTYNVDDIVEGVIPGSCGDVKYSSISYPAIKYRQSITGPVVQSTVAKYTVAYYTYQYKRPRTIQDVFKGEEILQKCNSVTSSCPTNTMIINLTEKYKTDICQNTPICYDTSTTKCDTSNYCCQTNKTNYE